MYLDLIIIVFLAWGMIRGFKRGLIIELCTLMALVLGVFGAYYFGSEMADYLIREFNTDRRVSLVLAFAILFVGIVIAVYFFGETLEQVVKLVALGLINKLAGLIFGAAKFAILLSGIVFLMEGFPFTQDLVSRKWKNESYLYEPIEEISYLIYPKLTENNWIEKIEEGFENIKDKIE